MLTNIAAVSVPLIGSLIDERQEQMEQCVTGEQQEDEDDEAQHEDDSREGQEQMLQRKKKKKENISI